MSSQEYLRRERHALTAGDNGRFVGDNRLESAELETLSRVEYQKHFRQLTMPGTTVDRKEL